MSEIENEEQREMVQQLIEAIKTTIKKIWGGLLRDPNEPYGPVERGLHQQIELLKYELWKCAEIKRLRGVLEEVRDSCLLIRADLRAVDVQTEAIRIIDCALSPHNPHHPAQEARDAPNATAEVCEDGGSAQGSTEPKTTEVLEDMRDTIEVLARPWWIDTGQHRD